VAFAYRGGFSRDSTLLCYCKGIVAAVSVRGAAFRAIGGRWRMKRDFRSSRCTVLVAGLALLTFATFCACDVERRKSDGELGLNSQQAAGRKIYDSHCDRCHEPYSTRGKKGPGLKGVFKQPYLSVSGLPANDERVVDIIRLGRKEMPGYSQTLNQQDIQELLAYLHTL
jgi:mono/diheme cytochrome c family protein